MVQSLPHEDAEQQQRHRSCARRERKDLSRLHPVKKNWGGRSPLDLLVSEDGGETFNLLMRLEDREGGEFSYPAITERDGVLHITYTYDREYIAYRQIKI